METVADNIKFKFADLGRFAVLKMPTTRSGTVRHASSP